LGNWIEIAFIVPNSLNDSISGALAELGAAGVWENAEPLPEHTRLVAYFQSSVNIDEIRETVSILFERSGEVPPELTTISVVERDWAESWKKSWSSFPLARRFFVIPSWSDVDSPADRLPIRIDPGQAFGTGTHETTQLTLQAMEVWLEPRHTLLDVGTGSGILAIAASMLDARAVYACDNDPVAVEVARENIERNATEAIGLMCGSIDAVATGAIGFIACNLTADAITEIFPEICRVMRPHGLAVLSGILTTQSAAIRLRAATLGLAVLEETTRGEWCALVLRKK
jgi:ribosomal protein L11 methyltransferase